ncbi:MAG: dephospho-CoA kinase [Candidatus Atribacteria bacterium]|nr:dephospho-CoA kinase [Candidatus Atribacteria bacterium]
MATMYPSINRSWKENRPLVVGVAGGMASGKSTFSRFLAQKGAKLIDLDWIARDFSDKGKPLWEAIVAGFGREFLAADGTLARSKLGWVVFKSWNNLFLLNQLTHPFLRQVVREKLAEFSASEIVVVDGAVLFEAGILNWVDFLIFIDAPLGLRKSRLREKGLPEREIDRRIKSQKFLPCLRRRAWKTIFNQNGKEQLQAEAEKIWFELSSHLSVD